MNYSAEIRIREEPDKIYDYLLPETESKRDRSNFTLKKGDKEVIIDVKAKDAVAFRATINTITQLLSVFQKVKEV